MSLRQKTTEQDFLSLLRKALCNNLQQVEFEHPHRELQELHVHDLQ